MAERRLLDVSHVSKRGSSLRVTVPRTIVAEMSLEPTDIVGFYLEDGKILIKKVD